ncbi:MAG: hypothetical protein ABIP55_03375, partial [Tepidisphaeraceae bacterium]
MNRSSSRFLRKPAQAAVLSAAALAGIAPLLVAARTASAQPLPIFGGPTYDQNTGDGYTTAAFSNATGVAVSSTGYAVGFADRFIGGVNKGKRALLLSPGSAFELTGLNADASLVADSSVYTINPSGQSVGFANQQADGVNLGNRPVRWDSAGNPFELGILGTDLVGKTNGYAYAINVTGQMVGQVDRYVGGLNKGERAVRFNATTGAAVELTHLGLSSENETYAGAYSINASGQSVGYASKYSNNTALGTRAVRWNAAGNALELANLGLSSANSTFAYAYAINASGQSVGQSKKYVSAVLKGDRAVRWDAASGVALELGHLGTDALGTTYGYGLAINDAGQTAGRSFKYVAGFSVGERAVRWNTDGSALELENLGVSETGSTVAVAYSINASGQTAGRAKKYEAGIDQGDRAVYWTAGGTAVDLNTLISPGSNWTLTRARAISDNGWIVGFGLFDPDGGGALAAYQRHFLLNISTENAWLNAAGGAWGTGGNWFTNFAPGPAVNAMFNLGSVSGYTVTSGPGEAKDLIVKTDKVTLNLAANTLTLNVITLGRDSGDVAHLTVAAGTINVAGALNIATSPGTAGTFTLTGGTLNAPMIVNRGTFHYNGGTLNATAVQLAGSGLMKLSSGGDKTLKLTTLAIADTS